MFCGIQGGMVLMSDPNRLRGRIPVAMGRILWDCDFLALAQSVFSALDFDGVLASEYLNDLLLMWV